MIEQFATLLRRLYGESYFQFENSCSFNQWKRTLVHVFKTIGKAIDLNIAHCDRSQSRKLKELIDSACSDVERATHAAELDLRAIHWFVEIIFQMLGDRVDFPALSGMNPSAHWRVNHCRSLSYSQSQDQKACAIRAFFAAKRSMPPALVGVRHRNDRLVEEFRLRCPQWYAELF